MPPRKRTEPSEPVADAPVADVPTDQPVEPEVPVDEQPAQPAEPDAEQPSTPDQPDRATGEAEPGTVTLATSWPHDSFAAEDGTEIAAGGTSVPADREKDIRAEAKAAGVTIRKVN